MVYTTEEEVIMIRWYNLILMRGKIYKYDISLTPYNNFSKPVNNDLALISESTYTLGFVQRFVPKKVDIIANNLEQTELEFSNFTLVPFLSNTNFLGGSYVNKVSINTYMGYSAGVGIEIGGLVNINRFDVKGFQVAGLSNIVGRNVWFPSRWSCNHNMNKLKGMVFLNL